LVEQGVLSLCGVLLNPKSAFMNWLSDLPGATPAEPVIGIKKA